MANAFLSTVKSQGYTTGLYTNRDFSNTYYNTDLLTLITYGLLSIILQIHLESHTLYGNIQKVEKYLV